MSQVLNGLGAKVKELPEGLIIEGLAGEQMSGGTADGDRLPPHNFAVLDTFDRREL